MSWVTWLLVTGVPPLCVVLCVRCPGPLGSCSPLCLLAVLCCVCYVLSHSAPSHRCACSVRCFGCAVSWATWLLFTGVPARCVGLLVRCPGPLCCCSLLCQLGMLCCTCGVLGHLALVHRCSSSVCCVACAESWATWLLVIGVPALSVALVVRCPGPLGSCSPACPLGVLGCLCRVLGHTAAVYCCASLVCCVARAVTRAAWLLFTGVPARCVVLRVPCLIGVPALSVALLVPCPGPPGSCSLLCPLGGLCCVSGFLGHLSSVHRCACLVCCVACAVSWPTWLLFTGVPARCVALFVLCPGPPSSCSPVCPLF